MNWFNTKRQPESASPKPETEVTTTLLERYSLLSARVTALELDLDNIRNKVLRREQKKSVMMGRIR